MASTVLTRHVCDQCGYTVELVEANTEVPPVDWADLTMWHSEGALAGRRWGMKARVVLCPACAAAAREHIGRPRKSPAQVAAEQPLGSTDG